MTTDPTCPTRAEIAEQVRVVRAAGDDVDALLAAAPSAPADQNLRDRIAGVIMEAYLTAPDDAAIADVQADAVLAALKPQLTQLADYENRITWGTTCGSCAQALDSAIKDHERAEKAEAALAEVRRLCVMTIEASIRAGAIDQARDTLAVLDRRMADEAQPTACVSAPCPHPGDCRHGCRAAADQLTQLGQDMQAGEGR